MNRANRAMGLFCGIFFAVCSAQAGTVQFDLLPGDGVIQGPAGSTIGWGYRITNNDSSLYWIATDLNSGTFGSSAVTALFDFPVVAPNTFVEESFSTDLLGLYELSWDLSALTGTQNQGVFTLTGDWYRGDPLNGGTFVQSGTAVDVSYVATVSDAATHPSPTPEPGTRGLLMIALLGLSGMLLRNRASSGRRARLNG